MIGLPHYLAVAAVLFTIGVFGIFVNRKNVIIILMSIELILLAVNINFVAFSAYLNDIAGQVMAQPLDENVPGKHRRQEKRAGRDGLGSDLADPAAEQPCDQGADQRGEDDGGDDGFHARPTPS